jgi:PEP-CTERM motif
MGVEMKRLALFFALLPSTVCAGSVTNVTITGPGGTGSSAVSLGFPEFGELDFTSLKPLDITFTVDGAGNYLYEPIIRNDTGATWYAFTLMGAGIVSGELPTVFEYISFKTSDSITFLGDIIAYSSPNQLESEFDFTTASAGTFTFEAFPNFVPEPSSWLLLALGSVLFVIRFRNYRKESKSQCS